MLSQLSKGYGSWTAGYVDPYFGAKKAHEHECTFPEIDHESHIHGITVGPRSGRNTACSWVTKRSREPTMDGIPLPKTYTTRKGALQLYVGPDDLQDSDEEEEEIEKREEAFALKPKYVEIKRPHGPELINLSLKLGTIDRLAMSVLQFGDHDYDHEHTSVTDAKNKAFLKFLHDVDEGFQATDIDTSVQPGGDLNTYLRDLKSSASNHSGNVRMSKSRESLELQAILRGLDNNSNWPLSYSQDGASDRQSVGQFTRPVSRVSSRGPSPNPPSTPRSTYQVLSAKKLCASIRSGSYLGRPSSKVSVNDDDIVQGEAEVPITSATVARPLWTPTDSTDDFLLESRGSFYRGNDENDSDGGKRRGLKERSFLTNNSQLYKGRIARKGDGQRAGEVKVISKGDGDSLSQRMGQIEEELGERFSESKLSIRGSTLSESEDGDSWAERVSDTKHFIDHEEGPDDKVHESDTSGVIDVEIDEKVIEREAIEKVEVRLSSRPGSHKSSSSKHSSRPSSHKSDISYCGSTSTHTPSIITLQSVNSPMSQEKFRSLYKRRNTYAYDPEKGLVRNYNGQRRKSDSNGKKNGNLNNLADFNLSQNVEGTQGAKRYNGPNSLHPGWTANSNNSYWSVNTDNNVDWQTADNTIQNMNDSSVDVPESYKQIQLDMEPTVDEVKAEFAESNMQNDEENVETAVIDQEEYILDKIEECNAEVKQIEEQAEGQDAIPDDDDDSDLDSTMDEELIKVILTGQSDEELKAKDEPETDKMEVGLNEMQDVGLNEMQDVEETGDIEVGESTNTDAVKNMEETKSIEDNVLADEMSESKLSEPVNEEKLKIVGKGQVLPSDDEVETVRKEAEDETVDEENASDVRSYKSGRKSHSKKTKSKSGVSSEEDIRHSEDVASTTEFVLPTLESERLLEENDAHAIAGELEALGLKKKNSKGTIYPLVPPGKRPKPPPEKTKIPDHIADALNRQTDASIEYLEQDLERRGFLKDGKVTALVGESLSGPTLEAVGEGLTEEELELAKQILQQKLDDAKGRLEGKPSAKSKGLKKPPGKSGKKGGKKGKQLVEEKSPDELDRESIREKHEQEKRNEEYIKLREQEAAELQKKIAEKQQLLKEQNDLTSARSKELKEEMERLEREAEAIQRAEDEAREILADVRKKQREEREARRKADLERKKQEALERREREKKEMEDKRRKENEMMEKIADAEMRRRMREEEERRIDEEERLAQERYEAELREAQRLEEEEEERLKEMERQAEEEAMQRLIEEREAAERERRRLREEEEALQEAENLRRLAMEAEQRKLEDEKRQMQEAENAKREAERQRLMELRRLEEEARTKMQEEIEKRRTDALARRDYNLENRMHVDKLRHYQGLTRAWTFSYFVHWPRETYESKARRRLTRKDRLIGEPDGRKVVKIKNPKPKQKVDAPPEGGEAPPAGVP